MSSQNNNICTWAILTLIMVISALFFGLRPKAWSIANDVQWLDDKKALHFPNAGIAYVKDLRVAWMDQPPDAWTIEMAVAPGSVRKKGFSPLLMMHDGADRRQLAIWQYGPSLIAMNGDDYAYRRREPRISAKNIFSDQHIQFLTITSSDRGTHLFVDGELAAVKADWKMAIPNTEYPLRLVLGNSVYARHGWTGDLHGLAISGEAISAEAIRLRFGRWAADRSFDFLKQDSMMLLFTFSEKTGNRFADQSKSGRTDRQGGDDRRRSTVLPAGELKSAAKVKQITDNEMGAEGVGERVSTGRLDLIIPPYVIALQKTILSLPVKALHWNRSATGDIVLNIVGFMPLGVVFYGWLQGLAGLHIRQKTISAVAICMILSFFIELAQAWIPTRVSSLTDLIMNTFGAWLGIGVWNMLRRASTNYRKTIT
jgi:hypothetical protein